MRISSHYRDLNAALHRSDPEYGRAAYALAEGVSIIARKNGLMNLLDYGCGKGTLKTAMATMAPDINISEYDPAIPGKDAEPVPADFVVCIDVLEHVEPETLQAVLDHIKSLSVFGALFVIDTVPAKKTLSDGRNTHLIVEDLAWWQERVGQHFHIDAAQYLDLKTPRRLLIVCSPQTALQEESIASGEK